MEQQQQTKTTTQSSQSWQQQVSLNSIICLFLKLAERNIQEPKKEENINQSQHQQLQLS